MSSNPNTPHPRIIDVADLSTFFEKQKARGWTPSGKGTFSHGLYKGNLYWKIRHDRNEEKDGYLEYAKAIVTGILPQSIHAPKIKMILIDTKERYAVLMEKLPNNLWGVSQKERIFIHELFYRAGYRILEDRKQWNNSDKPIEKNTLIEFVDKVYQHFQNTWMKDLHNENIMVRENGDIVLADPISYLEFHLR